MHVERTELPGIGLRQVITTADGRQVGVVTHLAGGRRDLLYDDPGDPDRMWSLALTRAEALTLAGLLGLLDVVDLPGEVAS
ncbi:MULTISPECIES: potassium transporter TrkA [Polymorphospora]|uniref:Potassium transporter TrkA n=1 Tax=Polymorphospora lycopeni TaxID=3140240 RepID=A0ABV5D348_9ACTN